MTRFQDVADIPEDDRIDIIGKKALEPENKLTGFVTDDDPGKAERYISKLLARFPQLEVEHKGPGPVPKTILVRVRRKPDAEKEN